MSEWTLCGSSSCETGFTVQDSRRFYCRYSRNIDRSRCLDHPMHLWSGDSFSLCGGIQEVAESSWVSHPGPTSDSSPQTRVLQAHIRRRLSADLRPSAWVTLLFQLFLWDVLRRWLSGSLEPSLVLCKFNL